MTPDDRADREEAFRRNDYTDAPDYSRAATRREVSELRTHVLILQRRLEREAAIVSALGEVLGELLGLDRQTLLNRLRANLARQPADPRERRCLKCGQPVPVRSPRCIYCGQQRAIETVADLLWTPLDADHPGTASPARDV